MSLLSQEEIGSLLRDVSSTSEDDYFLIRNVEHLIEQKLQKELKEAQLFRYLRDEWLIHCPDVTNEAGKFFAENHGKEFEDKLIEQMIKDGFEGDNNE